MVFLKFESLKKRFGKKEVLTGVSFPVKKGEIFGLIGKSGQGKSVLLKILIGTIPPDYGNILFEGKNALKKINYLRKNTGFAGQDDMLFSELSVWENSLYFGKLYSMKKKKIKKRFDELIKLLGLGGSERIFVKHLSGGMRKRVNILVSLIHNPSLLIMDEPTIGLDSILRNILWDYIHKINQEGTTILVTSHLLDEISDNCDTIGVLNEGTMISCASLDEYKAEYGEDNSLREIFEGLVQLPSFDEKGDKVNENS
jgi:ABC-2 type transport system ATP-binding protein